MGEKEKNDFPLMIKAIPVLGLVLCLLGFLLFYFSFSQIKTQKEQPTPTLAKTRRLQTSSEIFRLSQDIFLKKGAVIIVRNHAYIPVNKEGRATDFPNQILSLIRAFESSESAEVTNYTVDSEGNKIFGVWLSFEPRESKKLELNEPKKRFYIGPIPPFEIEK